MNNITELIFILDKSGSMAGMEGDVIGGFNSMINNQKKLEGEVLVSTILFSNDQEILHDRLNLNEITLLNENDYIVGGCTALLDTIGESIKHISNIHKYSRKEDIPDKTLFIITTDGMENASNKYNLKEIKKLIKDKEKIGWEFIFAAANIDAVKTAQSIGIKKERAVNYDVEEDTLELFDEISNTVTTYRCSGSIDDDWAKNIKKKRS